MSKMIVLLPIKDITIDRNKILKIQRDDLLLILNDQHRLNQYADHIVQAQEKLLDGVDPYLTQQLSQTIEQLIQVLSDSKNKLKEKRFNVLQKWLGIDIEYDAGKIEFYKNLEFLLAKANQLSQKLQIEIQKSQKSIVQINQYRMEMAHYIVALEEFFNEYPQFIKDIHPLDNFRERLSKKITSLMTLQANNDIAIMQMQLSQQIAFTLLDRFNESQQLLIPAWLYYVKQSNQKSSSIDLEKLDHARLDLISTLKKSLERIT